MSTWRMRSGCPPAPACCGSSGWSRRATSAGYGAHLNLAKLGETVTVFTEITLADQTMPYFTRFEAAMRGLDEVMECHLVSGGYDYLVKFVTRSLSHYQEVMEGLLERPVGISKYFSYIVIKTPVRKTEQPLLSLFALKPPPSLSSLTS